MSALLHVTKSAWKTQFIEVKNVPVNHIQYLPSKNPHPPLNTANPTIVNEPPPAYTTINRNGIYSKHLPSVMYQNGQLILIVFANHNSVGVLPATNRQPSFRDYKYWSIFNTLFSCMFLGCMALCMSAKAKRKNLTGDYQGRDEQHE
ncbi:hypothetical protein I4U23_014903 [Adineta vaga]|nr:hypothetical protein I4U23_014903 [Adineta vaga]